MLSSESDVVAVSFWVEECGKRSAVKKVQKRIMLNQRIRHHKGAQEKNPSAVNADGIFCIDAKGNTPEGV